MQNVTLETFQNSSYVICDQEHMLDHCCGSRDRSICQNIHSIDNALHNLHIRHVYKSGHHTADSSTTTVISWLDLHVNLRYPIPLSFLPPLV